MINLGDEVEDKITGFRGTVFAKHIFLFGMITVSVQPQVEQYGILPETEIFYEQQLKVIKKYVNREAKKINCDKYYVKSV